MDNARGWRIVFQELLWWILTSALRHCSDVGASVFSLLTILTDQLSPYRYYNISSAIGQLLSIEILLSINLNLYLTKEYITFLSIFLQCSHVTLCHCFVLA